MKNLEKPFPHHGLAFLCFLLATLSLSICTAYEEIPGEIGPVTYPPPVPAIDSPLLALGERQNERRSNLVRMLNIGDEALLARIHLIRAARSNIAIQTLIWVNDETGRLLMYELIEAARRGVKVRVLMDHVASEKHIELASFLAGAHENLEIKIYNPLSSDGDKADIDPGFFQKISSLFTSFNRFNQRMHNKVFIIDDLIGITGGRNNQNAYYDKAKGLNYKDRDIMVAGPVVDEMKASFLTFWNYKLSRKLIEFDDVKEHRRTKPPKAWTSRQSFQLHGLFDDIDRKASRPDIIFEQFTDSFLPVDKAFFIADEPGKNHKFGLDRFSGRGKITDKLAELVAKGKKSIYIQSPYLVLSSNAIDLFEQLRNKNPDLDIRISTNSLAATDSWYVYGLSYKQKQTYLNTLKFQIYELKPLPGDLQQIMPAYGQLLSRPHTPWEKEQLGQDPPAPTPPTSENISQRLQQQPRTGEPFLCLHAKSVVIDDEISFIGSYNLDPRSENLNTEVGLVIEDKKFAQLLKKDIIRDMEPQNSWVIAKKKIPLGLTEPNSVMVKLSELLPVVDPWPFRYASSFELLDGMAPLPPGHKNFYEHYRDVGSFPQINEDDGGKVVGAEVVKTFLSFVKPLL